MNFLKKSKNEDCSHPVISVFQERVYCTVCNLDITNEVEADTQSQIDKEPPMEDQDEIPAL